MIASNSSVIHSTPEMPAPFWTQAPFRELVSSGEARAKVTPSLCTEYNIENVSAVFVS